MIAKPGWLYSFFGDGGLMGFSEHRHRWRAMGYADVGAALEASMTSWDDFKWIREAWGGPIVAKGVHTADDARKAVDHGAAAIVVSNHGRGSSTAWRRRSASCRKSCRRSTDRPRFCSTAASAAAATSSRRSAWARAPC
jgi:isopentenyl diphosphate isomerase/L-lactate dehydrogenase-like FMN-dependent dehydrogenase